MSKHQPGDTVIIRGVPYTLIERAFEAPGQTPMWFCCERDNPRARMELKIEADLPEQAED